MAQHAKKGARTQAVTANRLLDGEVVYLTVDDTWSETLADAAVADGKDDCATLLARAEPFVAKREILDPYLFEVDTSSGEVIPSSVRERIRMAGPTVRPDLGKQAEERP